MKYGDKVLLKQYKNGNKLWGTVTRCCKCGGSGKVIWSYADHVCFDCDGKGWYYTEEREYTPENLAKHEAKLAKERAEREAEQAEREAERAKREAEWKAELAIYEAKRIGHYFGEIGQKVELSVTYRGCSSFETVYGWTTVYRFDTDDGAHLIWKTSSNLGGLDFYIIEDDRITIRATIKGHKEYHEVKQTELTRVKVVDAEYKCRQLTREELIEAEQKQKELGDVEYACWLRELYTR
jgi:hypothetical protein